MATTMKQRPKVPKPARDLRAAIRRQPKVFAVYLVLRLIVLATLVSSILRGEYENAFICLLVLALFVLPFFIFIVKWIKSSASLRSSTPNNCFAVYQKEFTLLLIQASSHPLLIAFRK